MIKLHLVIAAVSLIVVASTMVVNRYRFVMVVMMVVVVVVIMFVIVVMIVVVLQIPICHSPSSILLRVEVERGTHRRRIWRIYY
jgi:hypothetical protein